jgi:hypothetical protein
LVIPLLRQHPHAPLAPNADAKLVELAPDQDFDPPVLATAVDPPLLTDARGAIEPSHEPSPVTEETKHEKKACKWAVFI